MIVLVTQHVQTNSLVSLKFISFSKHVLWMIEKRSYNSINAVHQINFYKLAPASNNYMLRLIGQSRTSWGHALQQVNFLAHFRFIHFEYDSYSIVHISDISGITIYCYKVWFLCVVTEILMVVFYDSSVF